MNQVRKIHFMQTRGFEGNQDARLLRHTGTLSVPHYVRTARATPAGIRIVDYKENGSFIYPLHSVCLFRQSGARSSLRSPCILSVSDQRSQRLRQRSTQARVSLELAKRMKSKYIGLYKITILYKLFCDEQLCSAEAEAARGKVLVSVVL